MILSSPRHVACACVGSQTINRSPERQLVVARDEQDRGALAGHHVCRLAVVGVVADDDAEREIVAPEHWQLVARGVDRSTNGRMELAIDANAGTSAEDGGGVVETPVNPQLGEPDNDGHGIAGDRLKLVGDVARRDRDGCGISDVIGETANRPFRAAQDCNAIALAPEHLMPYRVYRDAGVSGVDWHLPRGDSHVT